MEYYGWAIGASTDWRATGPDFCDRSRALVTYGGASLLAGGIDKELTVGGAPVNGDYLGTGLPFGEHELELEGRTRTLKVIDGPKHELVVELGEGKLPMFSGHVALDAGAVISWRRAQLKVGREDGGVAELGLRPWYFLPDAGYPPKVISFTEGAHY